MKQILALLGCLTICVVAGAQKTESKEYSKMKQEVNEKIFGTPDPTFADNSIPDQYKNESAVILAQKYSLESDSKLKIRVVGSSGPKFNFFDIYRKKILINDQAALDEYSQVNFTKLQSKVRGLIGKERNYTFINIRLIKPNGTTKTIDVDESAITLKDEKNAKQNKIAIPDLAVGDVIDYYICNYYEQTISATNKTQLVYVLADDYPTLNYVISLQFDTRIAVEQQSINGAPDFKVSPDQDGGGNVLFLNQRNVPKIKGLIWSSAERQLPIVRVNYQGIKITRIRMPDIKGGEVVKVTKDYADIVEEQLANLFTYMEGYTKGSLKDWESEGKSAWNSYTAKNPKANRPDSIASFIFRLYGWKEHYDSYGLTTDFQLSYLPQTLRSQLYQITQFVFVMKGAFDQDIDLIVASGKDSYERGNLMNMSDLTIMVKTRGPKPQYFSFNDNLDCENCIPSSLQGEKAKIYPLEIDKMGIYGFKVIAEVKNPSLITLPVSEYKANSETETISASMSSSDPQVLEINRKVISTGHFKRADQARLGTFEEMEVQKRQSIGESKDIITRYKERSKSAKKEEAELQSLLQKARNLQKESIESELKDTYDQAPKEVKKYSIKNLGIRTETPAEFEEDFLMEGWVKKAGNNYIVDIGRLIASQIVIEKDQRQRTKDIYMLYPRGFNYHVEFTAPDGYSIEGIDKLNINVENETGGFTSKPRLEGNKIIIDINKYYVHAVEPATKWPLMLNFLDKALEFNLQKVLLKKK